MEKKTRSTIGDQVYRKFLKKVLYNSVGKDLDGLYFIYC